MNLDTRQPMIDNLGVLETAALLRELTAGLIGVAGFDEALDRLVRIARDAVPGVDCCGFTALRAGEPAGVAASDPDRAELDDLRHGPDTPALTAIRRREMIIAGGLSDETRWPAWSERARVLGVHGVISAPVDVDEQVIGAINLYAESPDALTPGTSSPRCCSPSTPGCCWPPRATVSGPPAGPVRSTTRCWPRSGRAGRRRDHDAARLSRPGGAAGAAQRRVLAGHPAARGGRAARADRLPAPGQLSDSRFTPRRLG